MSIRVSRVLFVCLVLGVLVLNVGAVTAAVTAARAFETAGSSQTLPVRLSAAQRAVALRPEVVAYGQRLASVQAEALVAAGDLDTARRVLIEQWGRDRSNVALRAQLKAVNDARFKRDSRKAHVLHGREKPGGILLPEDLLP